MVAFWVVGVEASILFRMRLRVIDKATSADVFVQGDGGSLAFFAIVLGVIVVIQILLIFPDVDVAVLVVEDVGEVPDVLVLAIWSYALLLWVEVL